MGQSLSVNKERLPFTDKQQKESGLNLVQFHFPNQSWQDDKKLSQPHDSNNETTEIVLNPFTRMRANEKGLSLLSQIQLSCLITSGTSIIESKRMKERTFCPDMGMGFRIRESQHLNFL